ncbi:hypothetical protein D3C79_1091580 [compost metagenome]
MKLQHGTIANIICRLLNRRQLWDEHARHSNIIKADDRHLLWYRLAIITQVGNRTHGEFIGGREDRG